MYRNYNSLTRFLSYRSLKIFNISLYSSNNSVEIDSMKLDDFTTQLIQKTVNKWCVKKTQRSILPGQEFNKPSIVQDMKSLNKDQLDTLFQNAIDVNDNEKLFSLIKQCIIQEKCPSVNNLMPILAICAQSGDKNTINEIITLCSKLQPGILEPNSYFQHYLAEATWVRGNIKDSLNLFKSVYVENTYLRRRIRLMLKYLIMQIVSNHSEAALITIIKFAEDLAINYKDLFPLTCIWQSCFLSEWFTNQTVALDLMKRHDGLCNAVVNRIPYVVAISLRNHRVEAVYRLLEILLEFDMNSQYEGVLLALLDYQMRQGNTSRCLEIIHWALENNLQLPPIYSEKFLAIHLTKDLIVDRKPREKLKQVMNFKF